VMYLYSEDYWARMRVAFGGAVAIHMVVLIVAALRLASALSLLPGPSRAIVLNLQPPAPPRVKRLVDVPMPVPTPVEDTNLIAEHNSKAQDTADAVGAHAAPYFARPSKFEQLAQPTPAPLEQPDPVSARAAPEPPLDHAPKTDLIAPDALDSAQENATHNRPDDPVLEMAQAQPTTRPETVKKNARGMLYGGVKREGQAAFEAKQDELAPYLRKIQHTVEARWQAGLRLKYRGTEPTEAVLDCAILPDGTLAYVNIVRPGDSVGYAALCKEAIEKSAPFGTFPFEVPVVHRTNALEIRWTFSFL